MPVRARTSSAYRPRAWPIGGGRLLELADRGMGVAADVVDAGRAGRVHRGRVLGEHERRVGVLAQAELELRPVDEHVPVLGRRLVRAPVGVARTIRIGFAQPARLAQQRAEPAERREVERRAKRLLELGRRVVAASRVWIGACSVAVGHEHVVTRLRERVVDEAEVQRDGSRAREALMLLGPGARVGTAVVVKQHEAACDEQLEATGQRRQRAVGVDEARLLLPARRFARVGVRVEQRAERQLAGIQRQVGLLDDEPVGDVEQVRRRRVLRRAGVAPAARRARRRRPRCSCGSAAAATIRRCAARRRTAGRRGRSCGRSRAARRAAPARHRRAARTSPGRARRRSRGARAPHAARASRR